MWRGGREWSEKPYMHVVWDKRCLTRNSVNVTYNPAQSPHYLPNTCTDVSRSYIDISVLWSVNWPVCVGASTVSKAALRSSSTTAHTSPASIVLKISLWTEMTAVSVEWCALQADWRDGKSCWDSMWTLHVSPAAAMSSTTFDKQLKLDSWRNEFASSGSSVGFFSIVDGRRLPSGLLERDLHEMMYCRS